VIKFLYIVLTSEHILISNFDECYILSFWWMNKKDLVRTRYYLVWMSYYLVWKRNYLVRTRSFLFTHQNKTKYFARQKEILKFIFHTHVLFGAPYKPMKAKKWISSRGAPACDNWILIPLRHLYTADLDYWLKFIAKQVLCAKCPKCLMIQYWPLAYCFHTQSLSLSSSPVLSLTSSLSLLSIGLLSSNCHHHRHSFNMKLKYNSKKWPVDIFCKILKQI